MSSDFTSAVANNRLMEPVADSDWTMAVEGNSATGRGAVSSDNHEPANRTATKVNAAVARRAAESNIAGPERVEKCNRSNFIARKYNPLEGGPSVDFTCPGMGIFHAGPEADIGPAMITKALENSAQTLIHQVAHQRRMRRKIFRPIAGPSWRSPSLQFDRVTVCRG